MANKWAAALLIPILLLALALRLAPWGQNRFLEDEALYAYWGLQIATGADPLLDEEPVDKPPLYPYTLALGFLSSPDLLAGEMLPGGETLSRLPSLFASIASIALVYALGWQLYQDVRVGLVAALLLALSPFDLLFASTAFTDPLMTALLLGAILAAARRRWGAAGLLIGLAAATKQQGLLFLPLVVAIGWIASPKGQAAASPTSHAAITWAKKLWNRPWLRFGLGFLLIAIGVIWWDSARFQRPGFLEQSIISYGGVGPAQPGALIERIVAWLDLVGAFWVSPWFNALLVAALILWFGLGWSSKHVPSPGRADLALLLFTIAYLLLHLFVGFQVWDRYLLALIPLVALLAARAFVSLSDALRPGRRRKLYAIVLGLVVALTLALPVYRAATSQLPVGGDHGAYDGIDDLAAYLRTLTPHESVLYHYWLGYHYRYYLYGAPLRLHWYPDLEDLTHDAYVYRREPRYIAFPSWRDSSEVTAALADAGVNLIPEYETTRRDGTTSFRLYRMEGP